MAKTNNSSIANLSLNKSQPIDNVDFSLKQVLAQTEITSIVADEPNTTTAFNKKKRSLITRFSN